MKNIILVIILFILKASVYSQSPSASLRFRLEEEMFTGDTCESKYSIIVQAFKDTTIYSKDGTLLYNYSNDWFTHDTTQKYWDIDFDNLSPTFLIVLKDSVHINSYVYDYKYSDQNYIFNWLFLIYIERIKCGITEVMKVYFPVKVSSFVTFINLNTLYFKRGSYNLDSVLKYNIDGNSHLNIVFPKNENVRFFYK